MRAIAQFRLAIVYIALGSAMAYPAAATVIMAENFNRTDGTNMDGATPNLADLPASTFVSSQSGWVTQTASNHLQFGADVSLDAPMAGYFTGVLHVAADISLGNLAGSVGVPNRGIGVGFNSVPGSQWNYFTGLRLAPDGNLEFEHLGINEATVALSGIAANTFYGLSYDVNVDTGVLSNIVLLGISANYSSIVTASQRQNYFVSANNFSIFAGGSAGGQYGYLDNLSVSNSQTVAVPDPVSLGILGLGFGALGLARRRRRGL